MIEVQIKNQSDYPISDDKVRVRLTKFLESKGVSDCIVSIAIVGEAHAMTLAKAFLKEDPPTVHNVLSFTETEVQGDFVSNPEGKTILGEIVICFPKAKDEAKLEGTPAEEYAIQLIEHGALHLMGIHHD